MARPDRRTVLKGLAAGGAALGFPAVGTATPGGCRLRWRRALNRHQPAGEPVINATQEVVNDIDHGLHGYWAYLDYRRTLRAWPVGGAYRAIVTYVGRFDGVEGALSYTGAETLTGGEAGTIHGGYAATIEGELLEDPDWPTHGFVGTTDYEGTIEN
ncbi:MAG: twin-arginine translocation signal domain-containing protein, partial [Actinobacteria bacterium]|nr:twin-arginine translocation signal domain-containing protein [Actinomycetota bacterium]NIU65087.1 twin-arginine translocation signal domain-containing protein [Actinomycetota bacterium]NIW26888.1 twin-arginine translocation signal domain-containing protein [Actinomycetota bacterium]